MESFFSVQQLSNPYVLYCTSLKHILELLELWNMKNLVGLENMSAAHYGEDHLQSGDGSIDESSISNLQSLNLEELSICTIENSLDTNGNNVSQSSRFQPAEQPRRNNPPIPTPRLHHSKSRTYPQLVKSNSIHSAAASENNEPSMPTGFAPWQMPPFIPNASVNTVGHASRSLPRRFGGPTEPDIPGYVHSQRLRSLPEFPVNHQFSTRSSHSLPLYYQQRSRGHPQSPGRFNVHHDRASQMASQYFVPPPQLSTVTSPISPTSSEHPFSYSGMTAAHPQETQSALSLPVTYMGGPGDFFSQYARKQEMHTIEQTPLVGIAGLLPKENEAIDVPAKPQGTKLSAEDATSSISAQSLGLSESSVIQSAAVTPQHPLSVLTEEFSSDSDPEDTHPNKFGIAIEEHFHRDCAYRRQPIRSGPQIKVIKKTGSAYNPPSLIAGPEVNQEQTRKYYRKDLVR